MGVIEVELGMMQTKAAYLGWGTDITLVETDDGKGALVSVARKDEGEQVLVTVWEQERKIKQLVAAVFDPKIIRLDEVLGQALTVDYAEEFAARWRKGDWGVLEGMAEDPCFFITAESFGDMLAWSERFSFWEDVVLMKKVMAGVDDINAELEFYGGKHLIVANKEEARR